MAHNCRHCGSTLAADAAYATLAKHLSGNCLNRSRKRPGEIESHMHLQASLFAQYASSSLMLNLLNLQP